MTDDSIHRGSHASLIAAVMPTHPHFRTQCYDRKEACASTEHEVCGDVHHGGKRYRGEMRGLYARAVPELKFVPRGGYFAGFPVEIGALHPLVALSISVDVVRRWGLPRSVWISISSRFMNFIPTPPPP